MLPPACRLFSRWFLACLILRPWRWRRHVPPECLLTFNGLHGFLSQKTELFVITAVRASDPTYLYRCAEVLSSSCKYFRGSAAVNAILQQRLPRRLTTFLIVSTVNITGKTLRCSLAVIFLIWITEPKKIMGISSSWITFKHEWV
jgi:hypothetical protein